MTRWRLLALSALLVLALPGKVLAVEFLAGGGSGAGLAAPESQIALGELRLDAIRCGFQPILIASDVLFVDGIIDHPYTGSWFNSDAVHFEVLTDTGIVRAELLLSSTSTGGTWTTGDEAMLLFGGGGAAPANIPEPGTLLLLGLAFTYLALRPAAAAPSLRIGRGFRDSQQ